MIAGRIRLLLTPARPKQEMKTFWYQNQYCHCNRQLHASKIKTLSLIFVDFKTILRRREGDFSFYRFLKVRIQTVAEEVLVKSV